MKAFLRHLLWVLAILIVSLPPAFVATFLLSPLWSWIELTYGIESMGHSGPADWCFTAIYALLVTACLAGYLTYLRVDRRKRGTLGYPEKTA